MLNRFYSVISARMMNPQPYPGSARMTRRQFGRSVCLLAGLSLLGRAAAARAAAVRDPAGLLNRLKARVSFYPRTAWSRYAPIYSRLDRSANYYRITIHHEGNKAHSTRAMPEVIRDLRLDQAAHRRLGYGDIGYHFMIDYTGRVWEGRALKYQGAHVSSRNPGNIGIVLLGNFEKQTPSDAQKASLVKLVAELRKFYGIGRRRVYGHRDLDTTLCPGRRLYAFLPALKARSG